MFGSLRLISLWPSSPRVEALAERVAGRSRLATWQRVQHLLPELGPTEARGYVRARAVGVVKEELARLIEQDGAPIAHRRSQIEESALKMLVEMIVAQVNRPRVYAPLRRAA